MEKIHKVKFHPYVKLGMMVLGYGLMLWFCGSKYHINGYGLRANISFPVSIAGFVLLILGIFQKEKIDFKSFVAAGVGILYISFCWGSIVYLESTTRLEPYPSPLSFPIFLILTIWINDTMAYIVGSLIGKTPLSKISPKKTWEGTIGGIILAIIVIGLLSSAYMSDFGNGFWYIMAAIAAIAATFGDLLESKLKRKANIKDSGQIMPGHGGFLDRFDSLLIAVPVSWFCMVVGF